MEKWSYNYLLFSRLSDVLEISGTEIAKRCGLTQQVFSRYTTNEIVVSLQTLIKICNALRMPIRFFMSENDQHVIPNRESATIAANEWIPIKWDTAAVEQSFGDGQGKIYWKDVAEAMGVTSQKPHERFLLRTRFPVTDFLATCNRFCLSPFKFLIDLNGGSKKDRRKPPLPAKDVQYLTLQEEMKNLHENVRKLSANVDELTTKYKSLLKAYETLEHRISVNIDTVNGGYIGIAAEPGEGDGRGKK